ncbi:MAG: hypothetical protein IT372_37920, partial [Polyangiaceae bacterium]|nr:hypothetical protein [Polyangiaceae bacterium]
MCSAFLVVCVLGVPSVVAAQDAPRRAPSGAQDPVTDALRRGRIARDAARWADAEAAFRAALAAASPGHAAAPLRAEIIGEIGLAELGQKKHRDAADHLDEALTLGGTALHPALEKRFAAGQRI